MGDGVGASTGEYEYISRVIKRIGKSPLDQSFSQFRCCDHQRLCEAALCDRPKFFQALGQIRCLLFDCRR